MYSKDLNHDDDTTRRTQLVIDTTDVLWATSREMRIKKFVIVIVIDALKDAWIFDIFLIGSPLWAWMALRAFDMVALKIIVAQ